MVAKIILSLLKHVDARVVTEAVETTVKCAKAPVSDAIVQMGKSSSSDLLHFTGKSLRARLAPVIEGYNSTKLATSRKFKTSEAILDNWDDAFGFADKSGVYRNAINRLNASGAIDDYILASQILRSGTSIGANINEANYGQSKADFVSKMHIALKETAETEYWLKLLTMSEYITEDMGKSLLNDCLEIKRILVASINTAKENKQ